jgi:hypothetical protein
MKKLLLMLSTIILMSSSVTYADCYEPTYFALECDSQGFDPCATLPCNDDDDKEVKKEIG